MTRFIRLAALAAALTAAAPAVAQQQQQRNELRIGLGVGIVPIDGGALAGLPPVELYVPIGITPSFRLEPSLGIFTENEDGAGAVDRSDVTVGVGAFLVKRLAPQVDMYAGGRLKLNFASIDTPAGDDSDTDLILAAALGGEYFFVPNFSIGLEGQLGLYGLGDVSGGGDGVSGFFTTGLAFLRFYL